MAESTWDGWTLPEEQAEPEDTAMPSRSKPITAVSALSRARRKERYLATAADSSEKMVAPGIPRMPFSKRF